ncbi:DNA-processing protein DprA [Cetobacterium sp. 8H]|uniref:DNA-processing protein DprA n=1 Tax=Cetobacterium sp. 8H TaxID=2759681 RepID=UPI00163C9CF4|nr:DNA-processing protein DprA [Cetobacterium sp. 8H]MBC2850368.1 DNA-processing protein DprA [Cetobacterium sp. 8H]
MYSKDDMILWSMVSSMVINIGKIEILAFSSNYLFKIFKKSSEMGVNLFNSSYNEKIEIINTLKDGTEKEKLKVFFGDFSIIRNLKKQLLKEKETMSRENIKMATYFCQDYPSKLRETKLPPYVIFYKGFLPCDKDLENAISIVGTRFPEDKGIVEFTEEIAYYLKKNTNYNISGLAKGCDTIGHKITLKNRIKNIAILGQGLGSDIYPSENKNLSELILEEKGALISEIPPTLGVKGIYLLQRNRLQAYLADSVFVLESGKKGGTITTIKNAFDEKRRVYIRNIKTNHSIFNLKNINKVSFISNSSDIEYIDLLTRKPYTLFTFEYF